MKREVTCPLFINHTHSSITMPNYHISPDSQNKLRQIKKSNLFGLYVHVGLKMSTCSAKLQQNIGKIHKMANNSLTELIQF